MKILDRGTWKPNETEYPNGGPTERFTSSIPVDGSAEANRYHLYVSYACPFAHRAIIYRELKGLQEVVGMSVLDPRWGSDRGWFFKSQDNIPTTDETTVDDVNGLNYLWEAYAQSNPEYIGRVSVPTLFDKKENCVVNNMSSQIIRMLDLGFPSSHHLFYDGVYESEINKWNEIVLEGVCLRIYQAGFAKTQESYDKHVRVLFENLAYLDQHLERRNFLITDHLLEPDIHLFTALCRFDLVYYSALRLNLKRLEEFKNLSAFTNRCLEIPEIGGTFKPDHIKAHYFDVTHDINHRIVPIGPNINYLNPQ